MASQLNIKDAHTVALARKLASQSRQSITTVIRKALEREEQALETKIAENLEFIKKISEEFRKKMPPEWHNMTSKEIMNQIYDEQGYDR